MQFLDTEAVHSGSDTDADDSIPSSSPAQPPPRKPYRINAQRFLFTYAQADFQPDQLLTLIDRVKPIRKALACREYHLDGSPHAHAAVEFTKRINHNDGGRLFELEGNYPSIEAAKNWAACVNYCKKGENTEISIFGAVTADEVIRASGRACPPSVDVSNVFGLVEGCESLTEWIQLCIDRRISMPFCKWIWEIKNGDRPPEYEENFPLPAEVTNPYLRSTAWGDGYGTDNRSLVICGPSGIGKTCWAMANIPCGGASGPRKWLLCTHIDDLRHFDPKVHRSILFDEIRWDGVLTPGGRRVGKRPLQDQIKITTWDTPVSIHCRYGVARIPAHTVKIFTCANSICFTNEPQVRRRCRIMNLYAPDRSIDDIWEANAREDYPNILRSP